jgi:drug/metabolite transporter (DMT)-like permease
MHRSRRQGLLAINAAALIFGSAALYGRLPISAAWVVAGRSGVAAITLAAVCALSSGGRPLPAALRPWLVLSGVTLAAHWLTFYGSIQHAGIAIGTVTFATFPLFTVLLEGAHRRQWPTWQRVAAACTIVVAVALLFGVPQPQFNRWGVVAGLSSALLYAIYWQVSRRLAQTLPDAWSALLQNAVVCAICVPIAASQSPLPESPHVWIYLLLLGLLNTAAGLVLYQRALRFLDTTTCSAFIALEPVYAILLARMLLDEPAPTRALIAGTLIVSASLAMLKHDRGGSRTTSPPDCSR